MYSIYLYVKTFFHPRAILLCSLQGAWRKRSRWSLSRLVPGTLPELKAMDHLAR